VKKILVTGGSGFIGSHLCERLLKDKYFVINLDNFNNYYSPLIKWNNIQSALKSKNYRLYVGDIRNEKILNQIAEENGKIDIVIHLAAMAGVRNSLKDPLEYVSVDIGGTVNILEFVRKQKIDKFIFASSSSVYGENSKIPFSEDDPLEGQISPYATAKRSGELYCKTYSKLYNIPTIILRLFTVYGPRQRPEMAIHLFTKNIIEDKPIPLFGNGSSERDYTYIDDVVDGILKSITYNCKYEIFNLGNNKTIKLVDLVEKLENLLNKKAKIDWQSEQLGDLPFTCASIEKAVKLLGYSPKVDIDKGLKNFIEWYRNAYLTMSGIENPKLFYCL